MCAIFGTFPHQSATNFESLMLHLTKLSLKVKDKNQLSEPCINHRTLVDPRVSTIGNFQ